MPIKMPYGVVCRVRILKAERIYATIELDGATSELRDVSLEELFAALDEAEMLSLLSQGDGGG